MQLATKYIKRSSQSASVATSSQGRTLSSSLPDAQDSLMEIKVQCAYKVSAITLRKGANSATFNSSEKKSKQLLLLVTVSGIVLVSSSNAELLETLEYDVTTAGAVLVSDPTTDVIAAIPLNRVFRLTRDGACVDFSYLAHITFVHLGKMQIINVAAKASTSNPLQKAMGDEYLHSALLQFSTSEEARAAIHDMHMATQRFTQGLLWLSLRFPLSTRVTVLCITCGDAVVATSPEFARPYVLPASFSHWASMSAHTTPGLLLLASSPVGPITWTLTDAHLSHALTTQDVSKGAVLRLRTQATDRGPGGREGGGLGEEGGIGMGGGEEGMGRQSSMSSSVGGSVGGGGGGGGGGVGDATQFGGGGARMLANTISLAGLSRDDQLKKYVVVHVKLHRGQGGGGGHAGGASRHTAASSKGGGVQTTSGTSSTTAMKALPHSLVHNLVVVVITLCTMWLLQGAPTHAAVASIQTLLLVIAGVCGYTYVSSSTTTRGVGGDGRGAGETETAGGGVVKGVGGGVQGGQGGVQWTIEILHAAVTQGVPDEPEEEESSQDTTTTPPHIPSTPPTPTLKGVKSVHTMTLTETKPLMPVALQDEFAELMMRCPQWMTQDTITRYVKGMGSEPVAYSCLLATVEWREKVDADHVLTTRPVPCYAPMKKLAQHTVLGPSKNGSPVILFRVGEAAINFPEILKEGGGTTGVEHYLVWMLEYCIQLDPRPWPDGKFDVIVDLAGVSMMHFGGVRLRNMNACLRIFEQHYKERLGRAVVLNGPACWKLITPLLPQAILDKIQVTTNAKEGLNSMERLLRIKDIPGEYGGQAPFALGESPLDIRQRKMILGE